MKKLSVKINLCHFVVILRTCSQETHVRSKIETEFICCVPRPSNSFSGCLRVPVVERTTFYFKALIYRISWILHDLKSNINITFGILIHQKNLGKTFINI